MIVEIKGVQFVNKGAELMLYAILDKCRQIWPNADICITPTQNSPYIERARIAAYQKLNIRKNVIDLNGLCYFIPKRVRHYFAKSWGIVTEADVDLILDASGFAYGDQWNTVILKQAGIEARRFKRKNKPYIFMPQAFGPFSSEPSKAAAKLAFDSAYMIFARDKDSVDYVKACAPNALLQLAPDFTNLLVTTPLKEYQQYRGGVAFILNSKMLSSKNNNRQWQDQYLKIMCLGIKRCIALGERVFLLNHEGQADQQICHELNQLLETPVDILAPRSALVVKAIIGSAKIVVSSRYHGCVSALSQGVPCIGTSWSHKYEQLFEDYQMQQLLMSSDFKYQQIDDLISKTVVNHQRIAAELNTLSAQYKKASEYMWVKLSNITQLN